MKKIYYRLCQSLSKLIMPLMPWRKPKLIQGLGSLKKLSAVIKDDGIKHVLIVTDPLIPSLGIMNPLLEGLRYEGVNFSIYSKTVANPTIKNVEEAVRLFHENRCDGIIAFGGGSSIDCAKIVGARLVKPSMSVMEMQGVARVNKELPHFSAVPTTAGTGSEVTIVAVVSDTKKRRKHVISDWTLVPHYAVLDPMTTIGLPQDLTSTTGMDALTHAVEAYIGNANTSETRKMAKRAIRMIFDNILEAFYNGESIEARTNMQLASYYAGLSFTRAYVGYIHAIAHTLGGKYNTPHGYANAVIMPYVLRQYGNCVTSKLSELSDLVGLSNHGDCQTTKAKKFIEALEVFNKKMGLPGGIDELKDDDIDELIEYACQEAHPLYPVPRIFEQSDFKQVYKSLLTST